MLGHVAPTNVAICCVEMLLSFGQRFNRFSYYMASSARAVDKTRNTEHGIIIIIMRKKIVRKAKFWAARVTVSSSQIGHVTLFFFSRSEQLLRNECVQKNFPPLEIN